MLQTKWKGPFTMRYNRIYDYAHELLARNPGSTIKVKVEENDGKPIFKRFYACLKECKDSFVSCRPIIGLDEAFLKGKHREVENKETSTWFMELLIEDVGGPEMCSSLTLISDQHKDCYQLYKIYFLELHTNFL